jgi:cytochrome c oxidase cbb3-type subunit 1
MLAQLTKAERERGLLISVAVALCGLVMAVLGRNDPLGIHGAIVILAGLLCVFAIIAKFYAPEPSASRLLRRPHQGRNHSLAMAWAVVGLFVGDWVAWLLVFPELTFDAPWASFGRIRPVHTTGVIFGFGGNALIATSLYVVQRTSRARFPISSARGSCCSATTCSACSRSAAI